VKKIKLFVCILAFFPCLSLHALDFGLLLDQNGAISNPFGGEQDTDKEGPSGDSFEYFAALIPRLSSSVGENGNIFISASVKAKIENEKTIIIPELLRTDFTYSFGNGEFKIGRMGYQDPLGFIAVGLFDGVNVSFDAGNGSIGVGLWYTGFLYKERTNILTNSKDGDIHYNVLDFSDFQNTYFAPRRILSVIEYENQGLYERAQLRVSLMGQFDLTGAETKFNSQYVAAKISIPANSFVYDIGLAAEMVETKDEKKQNIIKPAMAGLLGASYMFSQSRLSLSGVYSSGVSDNDSYTAFVPLTIVYQGNVLNAYLSGLSYISLDYLGRLHKNFSLGLNASSFIRTDLGTYAYPYSGINSKGYIVGTEFFGCLYWNPVSDIKINLGAGVFLPQLGNMDTKAASLMRAELNLVISLY
jgi:hypothetical protein